jgi:hypothetical protein
MLSRRLRPLELRSVISKGFGEQFAKQRQAATAIGAGAALHTHLALVARTFLDALTDCALGLRVAMTDQHS